MSEIQSKRVEELLEILVKIQLAPIITRELKDSKIKKLYDLTGKKGVGELSKTLGFSTGKISLIWQRWEQNGLIIKSGKSYKKTLE